MRRVRLVKSPSTSRRAPVRACHVEAQLRGEFRGARSEEETAIQRRLFAEFVHVDFAFRNTRSGWKADDACDDAAFRSSSRRRRRRRSSLLPQPHTIAKCCSMFVAVTVAVAVDSFRLSNSRSPPLCRRDFWPWSGVRCDIALLRARCQRLWLDPGMVMGMVTMACRA